MKLNKGLSACPILCENDSDYADGCFSATFTIAEDGAHVDVAMTLRESAIEACIAAGTASYVVHVECPMTSYRKKYLTGASATIALPLDDLSGDTEISTYIIATETIGHFASDHVNAVYAGRPLFFPKGGLLAIGPIYTIDIRRDGSGAQNLPDLFKIYGDLAPEDKQAYWTDLTSDTIDIHVKAHIKKFYVEHPSQKYLLNELLILPAATEALTAVAVANDRGEDSDYDGATWYRVFDETLRRSKLAMTDLTIEPGRAGSVAAVAQMMFHQPIESAIDALADLVDPPADWPEKGE